MAYNADSRQQIIRYLMIGAGIVAIALTIGFLLEQPWAYNLWPWRITRLSAIFIAASIIAFGLPVLWISFSHKMTALAPGALDVGVMFFGMAIFTLQLYIEDNTRQAVLLFAIFSAVSAILCSAIFLWSLRIPVERDNMTPRPVRVSFMIFAITLTLVGGAMILKIPNIFPWEITPELSVMYGWFFIGSACYFVYGLLRPNWSNAQGQLLGFLAYDLVLIIPFLQYFGRVPDHLRLSLIIYTLIIAYSGVLAAYYLLINRSTRFGIRA